MKIKRIISLITSSVVAVLAVSPFAANAYKHINLNNPYYSEYISELIPIDEKYSPLFDGIDQGGGIEKAYYMAPNRDLFLIHTLEPDYFTFQISKVGSSVITELTNIKDIKEKVSYGIQQDLGVYARFTGTTFTGRTCWLEGIENYSAKAISSYLKNRFSDSDLELSNFHYCTGDVSVSQIRPIANGFVSYCVNAEDDTEAIVKYVDENYDNIEINCSEKYFIDNEEYISIAVELKNDDWKKDYLDVALGVYNEFGYLPSMSILESAGKKFTNTNEINVENYVDGDANCDGKLTIADSTAILQSLGNADKYGLSPQGEFNADICNVGDGVTAMDALEVQIALASNRD